MTRLPHQEGLVGESLGPLGERGGDVHPAERVHGRQQDVGRDSHGRRPCFDAESGLEPDRSRSEARSSASGGPNAYVPRRGAVRVLSQSRPAELWCSTGRQLEAPHRRSDPVRCRHARRPTRGVAWCSAGLPADVTPEGTEDVQRIIDAVSERIDTADSGMEDVHGVQTDEPAVLRADLRPVPERLRRSRPRSRRRGSSSPRSCSGSTATCRRASATTT